MEFGLVGPVGALVDDVHSPAPSPTMCTLPLWERSQQISASTGCARVSLCHAPMRPTSRTTFRPITSHPGGFGAQDDGTAADGRRCTPSVSMLLTASRFGTPPHRIWPTSPSASMVDRRVPGCLLGGDADVDGSQQFAGPGYASGGLFPKRRWSSPLADSAQQSSPLNVSEDSEASVRNPVAKRQRALRQAAEATSDEAYMLTQRVPLHARASSRASSGALSPLMI